MLKGFTLSKEVFFFSFFPQKSELHANLDMASHFVSRHLVAGDLGSVALKKYGKVTTLQGINASITEYQVISPLLPHQYSLNRVYNKMLYCDWFSAHILDTVIGG